MKAKIISLTFMKSRGFQKKRHPIQIDILKELALSGKLTFTQIRSKHQGANDSLNKLLKMRMVVKSSPGIGRKHYTYYWITEKGLETLSKVSSLSLKDFWKISFLMYHKDGVKEKNFEKFYTDYLNNVLLFDPNQSAPTWQMFFQNFKTRYNRPLSLNNKIILLKCLGKKGPTSKRKLEYCFQQNSNLIKNSRISFSDAIENTIRDKLIIKDVSEKYRLTTFGLFLVLLYFEDSMPKTRTRSENKKLIREIATIIKKSDYCIPVISKIWHDLTNTIDSVNLLHVFKSLTRDDVMSELEPVQNGGVKEILIIQRMLSDVHVEGTKELVETGLDVYIELFKEGKILENIQSDVFVRLRFLIMLLGWTRPNEEIVKRYFVNNNESASFNEKIDNIMGDRLSFEFITGVLNFLRREKESIVEAELGINSVTNPIVKWKELVNNHPEIKRWYQERIDKLQAFERKNLEILHKRDFLSAFPLNHYMH